MGKSPGKWLKTLLFRKKSTRSSYAKARGDLVTVEKEKHGSGKEPLADLSVNSPLISQPVPTKNDSNDSIPQPESTCAVELSPEVGQPVPASQDCEKPDAAVGAGVSLDPRNLREEQAAIKAQAAFRGYLARRAFQALKGIIRLQALVRGHLVRRQAVATLLCLHSIIKVQAVFRGRRIRHSDVGLTIHQRFGGGMIMNTMSSTTVVRPSARTEKLLSNAFARKLLVSYTMVRPLKVYYSKTEPNSAWSWLERWTAICFTVPSIQPKRGIDSKPQKHTARATENDGSRMKRSVRTRPTAHGDTSTNANNYEPERSKRILKKVPAQPVEEPQSELEKVKRNLRKVSANLTTDISSDRQEMETEKLKRNLNKTTSSSVENHDDGEADSIDKNRKATTVAPTLQPEPKADSRLITDSQQKIDSQPKIDSQQKIDSQPQLDSQLISADSPSKMDFEPMSINVLADCSQIDNPIIKLNPIEVSLPAIPLENEITDGSLADVDGEISSSPKDDQVPAGGQKTSKRRSSFPENGLHKSPALPSYMAATESAKAKLRCQGSPRFGSDGTEGNGVTRRHSLPSVSNGKVSSLSPRTQRLVQSGKGNIRDKSLLSSRDGNEKVVHAEWRR